MIHIFLYSNENLKPYIWHAMDKHKRKNYNCEKSLRKKLKNII